MAKSLQLRKKSMPTKPVIRLAGAAALLLTTCLAQAQYVWVDDKGVRHFSDQPPPASTPASKILKAPGKPSVSELLQEKPAEPAPEKAAAASSQQAHQPTLAERDAQYRKREQERARSEAKEAEEARHKKAQAENCDSARRYKALLDTGIRVADADEHGERRFISDEERAQRVAKANKVIEGCR
jgi:type IV secretory pathway VirB10-like protein